VESNRWLPAGLLPATAPLQRDCLRPATLNTPTAPPPLLLSLQERLWQNQLMAYGTVVPNDTMAFLLGLVSLLGTLCSACCARWASLSQPPTSRSRRARARCACLPACKCAPTCQTHAWLALPGWLARCRLVTRLSCPPHLHPRTPPWQTFCTICPLIAPVTLGYFMFNYIVWWVAAGAPAACRLPGSPGQQPRITAPGRLPCHAGGRGAG
jgi:hypothetical protein